MHQSVLLSIITVNLNNAVGLKRTIYSVLPTLGPQIEFLILDGLSTDGSVEMISNVKQHLAYWSSKKDTGIYAAMNDGIRKAKGKYVLFLNSGDCFVESLSFDQVLSQFELDPDILSFCIQVETDKGYVMRKPLEKYQKIDILLNCLPHQSTIIKRSLFEQFGFYDESFKIAADLEFWLRIVSQPIHYVYSNMILSRMEKEGLGASSNSIHFKERLRIFNMYSSGLKLNTDYLRLWYRNRKLIIWYLLTQLGVYTRK